jgi:hypothetical protein
MQMQAQVRRVLPPLHSRLRKLCTNACRKAACAAGDNVGMQGCGCMALAWMHKGWEGGVIGQLTQWLSQVPNPTLHGACLA